MGGDWTLDTMPRIIHCSDLILRINQSQVSTFKSGVELLSCQSRGYLYHVYLQEISNVTEWLYESTEFRPIKADTCEIRDELDNQQKILVIVMIWTFLVFLSIFYCYFCEQKLFPTQMLFSTGLVNRSGFLKDGRCPNGNCNQPKR